MAWPRYTWDAQARQYRDSKGKFVKRADVRGALNDAAESAAGEVTALAEELQSGAIGIGVWQARTAAALKTIHTASGAVAAGGWAQATAADWSIVGRRLKNEYRHLRKFAIQLENGLPVDGRFLARAAMYAGAGVGTYEAVLRRGDIAAGFDEERRLLHSISPCGDCPSYAALGWQPVGTLPGIGESCACHSRCRCSFDRRRRGSKHQRPGEVAMPSVPMSRAGLAAGGSPVADPEKCRQRRRIAARRDAVNAVPVRLFPGEPPAGAVEPKRISARGSIPTGDAALAKINANLPAGKPALTEDDVYVEVMEAANSSFVADRFLFIGESTLKNMQADAEAGFAFMNSHRTGGISQPSELPFGRAFAGRFERWTDGEGGVHCRTLLAVYMLKGQRPNGLAGPSTDDIAAGIAGGTIFDVSVGLYGGEGLCDVCGNDIEDRNACQHMPGSTRQMTPEQVASQEARGVPDGKCSVTLVDAHCAEVSAVYDGAVPGAGFRKALSLSRAGALSPADLAAARSTFAALARPGDFGIPAGPARRRGVRLGSKKEGIMPGMRLSQLAALLGFGGQDADGEDDPVVNLSLGGPAPAPPAIPATPPPAVDPALSSQIEALRVQLAASEQARAAEREAAELAASAADINQFTADLVKSARLLPAAVDDVKRDLAQAVMDDRAHPVPAGQSSRLDLRKAALASASQHALLEQHAAASPQGALAAFQAALQLGMGQSTIPGQGRPHGLTTVAPAHAAPDPKAPPSPERQLALLNMTDLGRATIQTNGGEQAMLAKLRDGSLARNGHAAPVV